MSGIFPLRQTVDTGGRREPRLVDLDDEVADEVFEALSSKTTRQIFTELHESPQAASDLAEVTDTSVQNAQYHLSKLVDADLVEVVDTWYSERGTEMKVYAPTDESLVLFAGDDKGSSLKTLLKRVVGTIALLLPTSALVAWIASRTVPDRSIESYSITNVDGGGEQDVAPSGDGAAGADGGNLSGAEQATPADQIEVEADAPVTEEAPAPDVDATATPDADPSTTPDLDIVDGVLDWSVDLVASTSADPAAMAGVAFFLGGAFVLTLALLAWYWRT